MEFVAELVGHLAWPLALIVLVVVSRQPLAALIADVSEGEAGPSGFKFKRAARRTAEAVARSDAADARPERRGEADASPPVTDDAASEPVPAPSPFERYHATTSPELAIEGANRQVADRLLELLGAASPGSTRRSYDIAGLAAQARSAGLIPDEVLDSIEGLGVMHDLAASAPERVSPTQAQEFQVLAKAVLYTLSDRRLGRTVQAERREEPASSGSVGQA